MDADHQLIVRIKSFLNSTELINSQTVQELYAAYCELNNSAAKRLVECEVLLQKKQKIEAVVLAQQSPNLFEQIDSILFQERKLLLTLADLYDWKTPDIINKEAVANLKKAVSEMDDLRPLLTEFRRIARTDQVKNKLHLLREISRIDKGNPEWQHPLAEVENQYVSLLITEAQSVIQNKNFSRLEQIYEELKNSHWTVTIPTIVIQKIEKLILQHREEEIKKTAGMIIDRISSAYGAYDLPALEDAIFCWNEHCNKYQYLPDENENIQFKEANEYFLAEKDKQKKQQEHQNLLDQVINLINNVAPLPLVEKIFSQVQSFNLEIPQYIANRVAQYRKDVEREKRMATIIKAFKITSFVTVLVLILVGGAVWGIQLMIEDSQAKNLYATIKTGNIAAAQTLLREIEEKYPNLASRPKISRAKAALHELEDTEEEREREFERLIKELAELKKKWPPDKSLKTKLATAQKIAKTEIEKNRLKEFKHWIEDAFRRRTAEVDEKFLEKIALLKQQRDRLLVVLNKKEFDKIDELLNVVEQTYNEINALDDVSRELLADSGELLKSVDSLRSMVRVQKVKQKEIADAQNRIASTENLIALEIALQSYDEKIDKKSDKIMADNISRSLQDIAYFKAISGHQNNQSKAIPKQFENTAYFTDIKFLKEFENNKLRAKKELITTFDSLQRNINRQETIFIRLKNGMSNIDIYANKRVSSTYSGSGYDITLHRLDGTRVRLTLKRAGSRSINVTIDNEEYSNCSLVYPDSFSKGLIAAIKSSRAPHQQLIETIFQDVNSSNDTDVLESGMKYLENIRANKFCAPYWKMQLSLRILNSLEKIDLSPGKELGKLREELLKLHALDNVAGDPLENKFLAEKIRLFFDTYDFSALEQVAAQNKDIENFYFAQSKCKLQYLGMALNVNGQIKFATNANLKNTSAEVLCFDGDSGKCIVVGSYDNNSYVIDNAYQNKIAGRLLFTSEAKNFYYNTLKALMENQNGLDMKKIEYPAFWPINLKK